MTSEPAQPFEYDGLPEPRRHWAIATISLGIILAVIDSAIANVAFPTIAIDLKSEPPKEP
ncbi:MAG TPA: hypothetical protein PLN33_03575 [Hyphomonadaceae bacterium]|nr:hypothetical protein [Hyphomonadaceae bacterium]HPN05863.1 hypothetical protein [Hyphomonadaceae bacterium]